MSAEAKQPVKRVVTAWAAYEAKGEVKEYKYELGPLGPLQVDIKVECCGICHTDVHLIDDDMPGWAVWPQVCGHEIVGHIEEVGSAVTDLKKGDRVAVGCIANSCLSCEWCTAGEDNLCKQQAIICAGGNKGGFADYVRVTSKFAFPVPANLASTDVAPLLCAGITVYSPLAEHTKPGDHVAILGCGGLGHLAIKFAAARGLIVTGITTSADKVDSIKKLGATHVLVSTDEKQMADAVGTFDMMLSTVSGQSNNWQQYIDMLRPKGKLVIAAPVNGKVETSITSLLLQKKSVHGTNIGGRAATAEMLKFAAAHNITPVVQKFPFSKINEALNVVRQNKARFRVVLTH